jgi:hypothetical protein
MVQVRHSAIRICICWHRDGSSHLRIGTLGSVMNPDISLSGLLTADSNTKHAI